MTKILTTIGPVSEGRYFKSFLEKSDLVRLNFSHNTIDWHKKKIQKVKNIFPKKLILVDIPGVKPRTLNFQTIKIKKGQKVNFGFKKKKSKGIINLSNPLPEIKTLPKYFSLSDGTFEFKFLGLKDNILSGISKQDFTLFPKKGLNIPMSNYNDKLQEKLYNKFLDKIKHLKFDCIGLSFIQNYKVLRKLKKKFPSLLFISKIENLSGYINRKEIISYSDAVMIDRGDLAAEVGITNLSEYSEKIIIDCKIQGKPIIIATENLNSLINGKIPTKSDVVNIDYYLTKKVDYLMLSDETATSKNWLNTVNWLHNYLSKKSRLPSESKTLSIEEIIKNLKNQTVVVFSKKGYLYNKISNIEFKNFFLFTENKRLKKCLTLKRNFNTEYVKYPKKSLDKFFYENIKKNLDLIFRDNDYAYLVNVIFPRKNSRANSISIIQKKDFKK